MQDSQRPASRDLVGDYPSPGPVLSREEWAAQAKRDQEIWIANARRILDAPRMRWVAGGWVEDPSALPARERAEIEAMLAREEASRAWYESRPLDEQPPRRVDGQPPRRVDDQESW